MLKFLSFFYLVFFTTPPHFHFHSPTSWKPVLWTLVRHFSHRNMKLSEQDRRKTTLFFSLSLSLCGYVSLCVWWSPQLQQQQQQNEWTIVMCEWERIRTKGESETMKPRVAKCLVLWILWLVHLKKCYNPLFFTFPCGYLFPLTS